MIERIAPAARPLSGTLRVPGDKSLSHRAVIFAALAEGCSLLYGVLDSDDVRATIAACEVLGAGIERAGRADGGVELKVSGWGRVGPRTPEHPIDCGNSGTTARLLMGALAGYPVTVTFVGDASLSRRPMRRIVEPLERMGARFEHNEECTLPITLHGTKEPRPLAYASPVASAQVKTAILLAGLRAFGVTRVTEPALSRDHTERLLPAFGVEVVVDDAPGASVNGPALLEPAEVRIPGDPSSAAFPLVATALVPGSDVTVEQVSLNPTRLGFVRVMARMGVSVHLEQQGTEGTEPYGSIRVQHTPGLRATTILSSEVASLIDEVPVLAVLATRAEGVTRFEGVGELRVKESDRLHAIADGLRAFGATVREGVDWLEVEGPVPLTGAEVDALGDHRLAMTWAVAGLCAEGVTTIAGFEAVSVSYPRFREDLTSLI